MLANFNIQEVKEDNFDPAAAAAEIKEPITKPGDIWQLQHEPILYRWKPGAAHQFYGGRKQGTVFEEAAPIIVREDNEGALFTFTAGIQTVTIRVPSFEIFQSDDDSLSTVWRFEKPLRNGEHPTMKPIGLGARAIQNSSGQVIL